MSYLESGDYEPVGASLAEQPKLVLSRRLADLEYPYIDLPNGEKRQTNIDHTDVSNRTPIEETNGNYGIMPVGRLGFIDIDVPADDLPNNVRNFIEEHPTFTVRSPHGGIHLYYWIDGEINNAVEEWGEIRVNNLYVVGPGSTKDHSRCKSCEYSGVGQYEIYSDSEIATVSAEAVEDLADRSDGEEYTVETVEPDEITFDGTPKSRLAVARNRDKKFRHLFLWACGKRSLAGFDYSDRSSAEVALCQKCLWWFEWDTDAVIELFDEIKPPKWSNRGDRYRQSVMGDALAYSYGKGEKYEPTEDGERRRSRPSRTAVIDVMIDVASVEAEKESNRVSTPEVVEADMASLEREQTRKVLEAMEDAGFLQWGRDGNYRYWEVLSLPDSEDEFFKQFKTDQEIHEIRYKYFERLRSV